PPARQLLVVESRPSRHEEIRLQRRIAVYDVEGPPLSNGGLRRVVRHVETAGLERVDQARELRDGDIRDEIQIVRRATFSEDGAGDSAADGIRNREPLEG